MMKLARYRGAALVVAAVVLAAPAETQAQNITSNDATWRVVAEEDPLDRVYAAMAGTVLGITDTAVMSLEIDDRPGVPLRVTLPIEGMAMTLDLASHSARSPAYRLMVQQANGQLASVAPGPLRTLRGVVEGVPGSRVAASVLENGLFARIEFADGRAFWLEPLVDFVPGADAQHVIYRTEDVHSPGSCGVPTDVLDGGKIDIGRDRDVIGGTAGGGLCVAELACDADTEYFNTYGTVANTEARINSVINAVNLQYEAQVGLTHQITTIIVRTSSDPYTSTDAQTRLCQFITEWTNNQSGIQRDLAHLFTGVELNSTTIGIAADIGATGICQNNGSCTGGQFGTQGSYCLAQSDFNSNFACVTDLTAHEMGHLWGAFHCSCSGNTMNSSITCANNFSAGSINSITAYRDTRTCLDGACSGGPTPPPNDSCATPTLIPCNTTESLTNVTATPPSGQSDPELPAGSPSCQWQGASTSVHNTMWYSFVADDTSVEVQTCTSTISDTILALYDGSCGSLTELACSEDVCGASTYLSSLCYDGLVPGNTYLIMVGNPGGWTGSTPGPIELDVACPCPAVGPVAGACCLGGGSCVEPETPASCAAQGGTFQGAGSDCAGASCTATSGACCFGDGTCSELTAGNCATAGGTYQGDGTGCTPNPCPAPTGACCLGVTCVIDTAANCSGAGGTYQGDGSGCSPNPCSLPMGACCFGDGTCMVETSADCASAGGAYQGDGSGCSPNPCPPPTGACCLGGGSCIVDTVSNCNGAGGTYLGDGFSCGADSDSDGSPDACDGCPSDPNKIDPGICGCGVLDIDSDSDGTLDCNDGCPNDPNKTDPGACGCGVSDIDSDSDGTPDCNDNCPNDPDKTDPGACGCGVSDVDSDSDGTPDCNDGCPTDPNKTDPGVCGCGVPDSDTDGDGFLDCADNCPSNFNPGQEDCDNDGTGDACAGEPDCNNNSIPDSCDISSGFSLDDDFNGVPDECEGGGGAQFEAGTTTAGGTAVTVSLTNTYSSPVVVCTARYANNSVPVVPRVSNVTATSFDLRLVNPSGSAVSAESVSYMVMEEGVWTIDGVNCEAQLYTSTVTDENNSWNGEARTYGQAYTSPVVIGQVMTENDPDWSAFWCNGGSRTVPPSATTLFTGKMVAEDTDVTRADETVGFIVFEAVHGTIGGVEFEALLGADIIEGVTNSPPYTYTFNTAFPSSPTVAVASQAAMDGGNGGWAQLHGAAPLSASTMDLSIDEDQIQDTERAHITEQAGYVVFQTSVVVAGSPCVDNTDCDDGDPCNGLEFCDGNGDCQPGPITDCNGNGREDSCDIADSVSEDCNSNGIPDECEADGDSDGVIDACDNCPGTSNPGQEDCDLDGTGDACAGEPDCNSNSIPDSCDISSGTSLDANSNGVPDECEGTPARLEAGIVVAGGGNVTVVLTDTYVSPVVVCSVQYLNNTIPVVPRVSNVTGTSFDVRLQNPSGGAVAAESISYLVMEEGTWTIDGVNCEAQRYTSTVTDENNSWIGEAQSYNQGYTNPVVVGQVMTDNDPDWSVFWCYGTSRTNPPSSTALVTGKTVCEDSDTTRADETIGFIVLEAGHGTIGGVEYEALVGADSVRGVTNGPPYMYTFDTPFATAPSVAVTNLAGLDGGDGGWSQGHGAPLTTTTTLNVSIDEDQIGGSERNHTPEQVAYIVFASTVSAQTESIRGDLNGDGVVSPLDLDLLIDAWGTCTGNCPGDLDGDGVVGPDDLVEMLSLQ